MKTKMRTHFLTVVKTTLILISLASCSDCIEGNGKIAQRNSEISGINSLVLSISADVKLLNDSLGTISIEGESNLIDEIELQQNGSKLIIKSERCFSSNKPITISIPMKNISALQLNGSGNVKSFNRLAASNLELGVNGSGNIDIEVDAINVDSQINGSGNIILRGAAQVHKIEINGSGNIEAENFPTGNVRVAVNGSGDCKVMATTALALKVRGSGNIYYSGNPNISSDIKGSGSVEKIK